MLKLKQKWAMINLAYSAISFHNTGRILNIVKLKSTVFMGKKLVQGSKNQYTYF